MVSFPCVLVVDDDNDDNGEENAYKRKLSINRFNPI